MPPNFPRAFEWALQSGRPLSSVEHILFRLLVYIDDVMRGEGASCMAIISRLPEAEQESLTIEPVTRAGASGSQTIQPGQLRPSMRTIHHAIPADVSLEIFERHDDTGSTQYLFVKAGSIRAAAESRMRLAPEGGGVTLLRFAAEGEETLSFTADLAKLVAIAEERETRGQLALAHAEILELVENWTDDPNTPGLILVWQTPGATELSVERIVPVSGQLESQPQRTFLIPPLSGGDSPRRVLLRKVEGRFLQTNLRVLARQCQDSLTVRTWMTRPAAAGQEGGLSAITLEGVFRL
jgi:hypothetical protein